jgi:hypothetical protein
MGDKEQKPEPKRTDPPKPRPPENSAQQCLSLKFRSVFKKQTTLYIVYITF